MIAAIGITALVILVLLAFSAVFSAAETALTRASRGRMHQLERDGDKDARRVNRLLSDQETMLGAVLIGYNVINILTSAMAQDKKAERGALTFILARGIGEAFVAKGVDRDAVHAFLVDEGALP